LLARGTDEAGALDMEWELELERVLLFEKELELDMVLDKEGGLVSEPDTLVVMTMVPVMKV
jgi:hypothetical protein